MLALGLILGLGLRVGFRVHGWSQMQGVGFGGVPSGFRVGF